MLNIMTGCAKCDKDYVEIIKGTTPTHIFTTDVDLSDVVVLYITYSQEGAVIIEKDISDIAFGDMELSVTLSQNDTLKFDDKSDVEIQIRGKFADGTAIASEIMFAIVKKVLKDSEI